MSSTPITVDPGEECLGMERLPVTRPPTPRKTYMTGFSSDVGKPTHHEVLFFTPTPLQAQTCCGPLSCKVTAGDLFNGAAALANCGSVLQGGGAIAYMPTGEGHKEWRLQNSDYGLYLGDTGDGQWVTNRHFLNTTDAAATSPAIYRATVTDYVPYPTGMAQLDLTDVNVPPQAVGTLEGTVTAPFPMDILWVGTHIHNRGVKTEVWLHDGQNRDDAPFYTSTNWDSPELYLPPQPIHLEKGQGLTLKCTWNNYESYALTWGEDELLAGQREFEMCLMWVNYAYPRCSGYSGLLPPNLGTYIRPEDGGNGATKEWTFPEVGWYFEHGTTDQVRHESNVSAAQAACPAAH